MPWRIGGILLLSLLQQWRRQLSSTSSSSSSGSVVCLLMFSCVDSVVKTERKLRASQNCTIPRTRGQQTAPGTQQAPRTEHTRHKGTMGTMSAGYSAHIGICLSLPFTFRSKDACSPRDACGSLKKSLKPAGLVAGSKVATYRCHW